LGIPASFWLSLQSAYEEDLDKSDNKGMVRTFLDKFTRNRVAF
jgi:antitoxin HigA-1